MVNVQINISYDMTSCILVHSSQRFKETYCLYLHGRRVSSSKTSVTVILHGVTLQKNMKFLTLGLTTVYLIIDELKFRKTSVLAYTKALLYYVNSSTLQSGEKTGYGP